jgi:hypothetical protein
VSITLFDGVTLTVEAALSAATGSYGAWDSALFNTATFGPDVVWTDISEWVRSVLTSRGFSRDVAAWEAGAATIVLANSDGRFSPANLTGPYVTSGVTGIRPWRPVRVRATYNSITYDVFSGYALAWQESWEGGGGTDRTGDAVVTVPCADELARLSGYDGYEQPPAGGGETAGQRIHRILNTAGHTGNRAVDPGRQTMQATTLAANTTTELKLTADSEGGALYIAADGTVVFENQYALMENTRSNTVQATWGDGPGELAYDEPVVSYDGDLVANIASFAAVGSTAQIATDNTSRALYGDRTEVRTDLICETDAQALALATWHVQRYKDPELRVEGITVRPRNRPALLFPQVLGRQVRDLMRVVRRPPGDHTITRDVFVSGITHTITGGTWVTAFELWSASPYTIYATSLWDAATWDSSLFFY